MTEPPARSAPLRRFLAPLALLLGAVAAFALLRNHLGFEALARHHEALALWRADHLLLAPLAYVAAYALLTAVSAPGAIWMTLAGGLLFGPWLGAALAVIGATSGAAAVFLAARGALADVLRARAGPWLERFAAGFREDAAGYMLALRLTPVAPFFIVNLAPAFLGVPLRTYLWTTLIGIFPGALVFASAGAGLGALIERGEAPDVGAILGDGRIIGPLLGLAALSLLPAGVKFWKKRASRGGI